MKKLKNHFLSVIVPVFGQEKSINQDIRNIYFTLTKIRYPFELIAVVDGTRLDRSYAVLKRIRLKNFNLLGYKKNRGKGYAVRYGMAQSRGDYIAFIDSGMDIDPNGLSLILEHMEWYQADIIVGSKRHPASRVVYPWHRKIISLGASLFARLFLGLKIRDTQSGLKIFKRPVLEKVLPRLLVKEFAFDLEILSVAHRLGFKRIYEAPIKINYDFHTLMHAKGLKIVHKSLLDALAVFYRLRILKYYDDKNQRQ